MLNDYFFLNTKLPYQNEHCNCPANQIFHSGVGIKVLFMVQAYLRKKMGGAVAIENK